EAWHIGGARPAESYLRGEKILQAARASGAQAIHPGYGFLSENAAFARACSNASVVFVGPSPEAIDAMGSKSNAKALMEKAGVPVVPGYHGIEQAPEFLAKEASRIGYPLLIKAVAGGGGKGMRLVHRAQEFLPQLEAAKREAKNAFGNDDVLIERYVQGPHHIEFQVFGDHLGNTVHLFERECSIQRRHQKILEETPSPFLDDSLREKMAAAAVAAAKTIGYTNAGTVEFIAGEDREFFFMEMNTRLQVEHPVTELTTGQDLVEWQLRVAAGEPLPLLQNEITRSGHAIEVRICAENPHHQFLPQIGRLDRYVYDDSADGVRVDTGVTEGDEIGIFYDPMIAKLIVHGHDRRHAQQRLSAALHATAVVGVKTNLAFLTKLVGHEAFSRGDVDTHFIDKHGTSLLALPERTPSDALIFASVAALRRQEIRDEHSRSPWAMASGWRLNGAARRSLSFTDPLANETIEISAKGYDGQYQINLPDRAVHVVVEHVAGDKFQLAINDQIKSGYIFAHQSQLAIHVDGERYELTLINPFAFEHAEEMHHGRLTALMPGRIVKVMAQSGDEVKKGQALLIMEAMKMEHTIHAPLDGEIERVFYRVDDVVPADAPLFSFKQQV
ncbi:MAG: biotin carboxylase N-terminal domain-containing protein, partial [Burkholderiales bacterium]